MYSLPQDGGALEILCFKVHVGAGQVTAFMSRTTWCACHGRRAGSREMADIYRENRPEIDGIVTRKALAGARSPIVLKAADL
jgi:hypothetical protein